MNRVLAGQNSQRGVVLVVVLIMLGVFSVIVVSMIGGSNINFKIAGNQQYRMEAKLAARHALETYVSNPNNFALPLPTGTSAIDVDFNGDGVADMSAAVPPPTCLRTAPVMRSELKERNVKDRDCFKSVQTVGGNIFSDTSGTAAVLKSGCVKMTWDTLATVNDNVTGAAVEMHQGVYLRAGEGTTCR
ncbi:MAG: PilX N-terminal domain-containing pilus assembly protein [Zhongshania sp.]|uniref:PilX N-terminal domain-containing pilus assembly protein n=1 Tax=Zhongshania sp. TaxID=1971902 RepID=UPI00261FFF35|nr:PilX N-terminal domain-containing pilus assembly protein [Zhongshania sp.]MDF1691183.1 PilX N-terminal domain-containing pilus assembly protein [Zhongshania sp.]